MLLSSADVKRLERAGYEKQRFMYYDKNGYARLKNHHGFCVFYDIEKRRCKTYRHRPSGCRVYPVIYSEQEGIIIDDLCPVKNTISQPELKTKGRKVMKLIQRIDNEATTKRDKVY
jgi:Fe-S-cluster containining protein